MEAERHARKNIDQVVFAVKMAHGNWGADYVEKMTVGEMFGEFATNSIETIISYKGKATQ